MKKSKSSKGSKSSKLSKRVKTRKISKIKTNLQQGGKKYKEVWCSQSIVNLPRMECLKQNCTGSKEYKDNISNLLLDINNYIGIMHTWVCYVVMSRGTKMVMYFY